MAVELEATSDPEEWERRDEEGGEDEREDREQTKREQVVDLLQTDFWDRVLTDEATWQAVVLILKGGGDYRIIGIAEVVWKAVAVIFNLQFTASITYHNPLHELRAGHGTGTSILEVKLIQQVPDMR